MKNIFVFFFNFTYTITTENLVIIQVIDNIIWPTINQSAIQKKFKKKLAHDYFLFNNKIQTITFFFSYFISIFRYSPNTHANENNLTNPLLRSLEFWSLVKFTNKFFGGFKLCTANFISLCKRRSERCCSQYHSWYNDIYLHK